MKSFVHYISVIFGIFVLLPSFGYSSDALHKELEELLQKAEVIDNSTEEYLDILNHALVLSKGLEEKNIVADIYMNIATFYHIRGEYPKAILFLKNSQDYYIELNNQSKIIETNITFGDFYRSIIDYKQSTSYLHLAITDLVNTNDTLQLARAYNRLAATFFEFEIWDSLTYYSYKSIDLLKLKDTNHILIGNNYNIIGTYYVNIDNQLAKEYLNKALDIYKSHNHLTGLPNIYINMASSYYKDGDLTKTLEFATIAYDISKELNIKIFMSMSSEMISFVHYELGNYKEAYDYRLIFQTVREDLFGQRVNADMRNLQTRFDEERLQSELIARQKAQNYQTTVLLAIIIGIMVFVIILVLSYRTLRKKNALLQEQNILIEKQKDELTELNATKDKFFSILAHDLKGPLGSFKNLTELFESNFRVLDDEEKLEFVQELNLSSMRIYDLLENLLIWSRSQRGIIQINPDYYEIKPIIKNVADLLKLSADAKQLEIVVDVPDEISCYIDPNILLLVVRNLLSNAIKFSHSNNKIIVSAKQTTQNNSTEKLNVFTVQDFGVGISKDDIEKLFRIDVYHSSKGTAGEKGTGLGFTIVKEFIEKQGGKVSIESELGKGTTVKFTLPCMMQKT